MHCTISNTQGVHAGASAPPEIGSELPAKSANDTASGACGRPSLATPRLAADTTGSICGQSSIAAGCHRWCGQHLQVVTNHWSALTPPQPTAPPLPEGACHSLPPCPRCCQCCYCLWELALLPQPPGARGVHVLHSGEGRQLPGWHI